MSRSGVTLTGDNAIDLTFKEEPGTSDSRRTGQWSASEVGWNVEEEEEEERRRRSEQKLSRANTRKREVVLVGG